MGKGRQSIANISVERSSVPEMGYHFFLYREIAFLFAGLCSGQHHGKQAPFRVPGLPYLLHLTDGERMLVGACDLPGAKALYCYNAGE